MSFQGRSSSIPSCSSRSLVLLCVFFSVLFFCQLMIILVTFSKNIFQYFSLGDKPLCMAKTFEDVPLVEFMYLVFTRMSAEDYRRRLGSLLLYLCCVFRALINSLFRLFYFLVWLLLSSYMIVIGGRCTLLPYGTGICHYSFTNIKF